MESKELKPTAFHRWLMRETGGDKNEIMAHLEHEIINNRNPQVFTLMEATGDAKYTAETIHKAADLLIEICNKNA